MQIIIAPTYKDLSAWAAEETASLMRARPNPLICTASGDTPAGLYSELVAKTTKKEITVSDWCFISLDEWTGLNGTDEGSCRYHLNNQLFEPLQISANKIFFFDGRAEDLEGECAKAEDFIKTHGPIDVSILGVGMNGHIGMNEPGTAAKSRSHVTKLDPITQQVGQKYFKESRALTGGITLGMDTLMESKHIILLVSGSHKAPVVKTMLESDISEQLPASLLRDHPGAKLYLDADAAQFI